MSFRSALAFAVVCAASACSKSNEGKDGAKATSPARSDPSASTETVASETAVTDDENDAADAPSQVSGAFLVACEPLDADIPFLAPADGEKIGGCTVVDKESGTAAVITPGTLKVKLAAEDGTEILPEAIMPPEDSKYHFYVIATPERMAKVKILLLEFEKALSDAMNTYSDQEIFDKPGEIGGKVAWETFADLVNNLDLPTSPLLPMPADGMHLVFASHKVYAPNFGGVEGGDAICAELGKVVDGARAWMVVLSSSTVDARDRIEVKGPIYNLMGEVVAKDAAELWGAATTRLTHAVKWTERGFDTSKDIIEALGIEVSTVWSGSTADGKYTSEIGSCSDWTSVEFEGHAAAGHSDRNDASWIGGSRKVSCSHMGRLFCISK
jgi:hypothetical protein